jgi:16S rRNA (guanine527-N7)-methyltransferase
VADLADLLKGVGIEPTGEMLDAFAAFEEDLYQQNAVMNLTRVPREECAIRHFIDSLLFQDLIPLNAEVLDIGTGPGFPAWPLALARPDLKVTAMDSSGKMLGFLKRHPLPNLTIVEARAEDAGLRGKFDVVTGRALAPLSIQLELSALPCREKGAIIPMRTPSDQPEIERLRNVLGLQLEQTVDRTLPVVEAPRTFPIFRKAARTPAGYPRSWSEIKRKPL